MPADATPAAEALRGPQRVLPSNVSWPLFDAAASRAIEADALATAAPQALMQAAGLAVAKLALAVAPHARRFWVACGPGHNGGDGLIAATQLHGAGRAVQCSLCGDEAKLPPDAAAALAAARAAGVPIASGDTLPAACDLAIDALLGLGIARAPQGTIAAAIAHLNAQRVAVLAVDMPSGLRTDTGTLAGAEAVRATHTLSLLTLKPGLFTAAGRDHAGTVWLDSLGVDTAARTPTARLAAVADWLQVRPARAHASHKGRFGDVAIVGGAAGMHGAATLAAASALAAGAGRIFVTLLDAQAMASDAQRPELMLRPLAWLRDPAISARLTVVCGCGGGAAVREVLPLLLARCPRLVLDADALNALAADTALRAQLRTRAARGLGTVLTPHPLEAARLLQTDVAAVQADRLHAAQRLAQLDGCVVLLKGSGSIVAMPAATPVLNPTGNALLAAAGSGDVLAGWTGGLWAQLPADDGTAPHQAAVAAAWLHGFAADRCLAARPAHLALRALELIEAMRDAAAGLAWKV